MNLVNILWLHGRVGNAAPLFMAVVGILSLINFLRNRGVDGNILGAVVIGEIMMIVQAGLGVTLWIFGLSPARLVHILYGSVTILTFPALWVYTHGETNRRASLIWGLAGLFMMGLAFRAIGTAS